MLDQETYKAKVEDLKRFSREESLENLGPGHVKCPDCGVGFDLSSCPQCGADQDSFDEPFISSEPCPCCLDYQQGERVCCSGYRAADQTLREYVLCRDCAELSEYLEWGRFPTYEEYQQYQTWGTCS